MLIIPSGITLVYALVFSKLLPSGVNQSFSVTLIPLSISFLLAGLFWFIFARKPKQLAQQPRVFSITVTDSWLVLIPLSPVVTYVILNRNILSLSDIIQVLVVFALSAFAFIVVVPALFSRWSSRTALVAVSISLCFAYTNMATLSRTFNWHQTGQPSIQIPIFLISIALVGFLYRRDKKTLIVLSLLFFIGGIFHSVLTQEGNGPLPAKAGEAPQYTTEPARTPDIFLLTYDAYVENETMLQYGIDNSEQEEWLENHGFHIYRGTYSVSASTLNTMGLLLGNQQNPALGVAGESPLFRQLKHAGYQTHGIFNKGYFFQGIGGRYDVNYPLPTSSASLLSIAILEGQFRHNTDYGKPDHADFVKRKRKIMEAPATAPIFMYTHTGPGHSQNSGACRPNEIKLYEERLIDANVEMREDIDTILANHPSAIIIVNGDHGPYLTKTCYDLWPEDYPRSSITRLDIQDRYGTFLAIRWPEKDPSNLPPTKIRLIQDVGSAILSYLYPDKSFTEYRIPHKLINNQRRIGGLSIQWGRIIGGPDHGKPLFKSRPK